MMKELLELLEKDHTLTHEQLAVMLNMSASEIAALIKKWEEDHRLVVTP